MLNPQDWEEIARTRAAIRADRPATISLRRAETSLSAQEVRIARLSSGSLHRSEAGRESRSGILVSGAPTLDIRLDDRFTLDGAVYRVVFVRPNRETGTQAEAVLVQ